MVDATIVPVPKQRNTREENEAVKAGQTPEDWEKKPAKNQQKDKYSATIWMRTLSHLDCRRAQRLPSTAS